MDKKVSTVFFLLTCVHQVNTESGDIVPFNQFYIPEIQATIDIRADYFNWIQNQVLRNFYVVRRIIMKAVTDSANEKKKCDLQCTICLAITRPFL